MASPLAYEEKVRAEPLDPPPKLAVQIVQIVHFAFQEAGVSSRKVRSLAELRGDGEGRFCSSGELAGEHGRHTLMLLMHNAAVCLACVMFCAPLPPSLLFSYHACPSLLFLPVLAFPHNVMLCDDVMMT